MDRYTVISADCHGGAQLYEYRDYLEGRYLDEFDDWARDYAMPFEDLRGEDAYRNWDSKRRLAELEEDGIVAEVIFPNTIPPFYPTPSLLAQPPPPDAGDLEKRWAGLRAHNRWLADFCSRAPGRRAGVAQIMLHDVEHGFPGEIAMVLGKQPVHGCEIFIGHGLAPIRRRRLCISFPRYFRPCGPNIYLWHDAPLVTTGIICAIKMPGHSSCDNFVDQLFVPRKVCVISFRRPEKSSTPWCQHLDQHPNEAEIFPSA